MTNTLRRLQISSAARWSYTAQATHWALQSADGWTGVPVWAAPETFACDYTMDSRLMRDARGDEFTTREVIFTERSTVRPGDRVLIGVSALLDPVAAGAREVRSVMRYGDTLERKADDYMLGTV